MKKPLPDSQSGSKNPNNKLKKCTSLSELSISEIQELKTTHDSIDFQQQRDLISDFIHRVDESAQQYGLPRYSSRNLPQNIERPLYLQIQKNQTNQPRWESISITKKSKPQELCFDKEKRRKQPSRKFKMSPQIGTNTERRCSEKVQKLQKKQKNNFPFSSSKMIPQTTPPIPPLHQHFKHLPIQISLKCQKQLFTSSTTVEPNFPKLYHLRSDDLRKQVNDINTNLHLSSPENEDQMNMNPNPHALLTESLWMEEEENNKRKPLNRCAKNSNQNNEERQIFVTNCYYQPLLNNSVVPKEAKIFEVKRPVSLNYKVGGAFPSTSLTKESPFSRDSSTGTQKTVKKHSAMTKKPVVASFIRSQPISGRMQHDPIWKANI